MRFESTIVVAFWGQCRVWWRIV